MVFVPFFTSVFDSVTVLLSPKLSVISYEVAATSPTSNENVPPSPTKPSFALSSGAAGLGLGLPVNVKLLMAFSPSGVAMPSAASTSGSVGLLKNSL